MNIGYYYVTAINCTGSSNVSSYFFRREADWWCNCARYNPCTCPPKFEIGGTSDPCGNYPEKKLDFSEGIEEFSDEIEAIVVFPNPSAGQFEIVMPEGEKEITITNLQGKIIFEKKSNLATINIEISRQPPGIFFVFVKTKTATYKSKMLIQDN